jgi:hypothetical protein
MNEGRPAALQVLLRLPDVRQQVRLKVVAVGLTRVDQRGAESRMSLRSNLNSDCPPAGRW